MHKRKIVGIDCISSSDCNMRCEFCYLHKNKAYQKFNEEVIKAWQNGSYVDNMYKVICKLNSDPIEMNHIALWGGETTLHINNITDNIERLTYYFKKLQFYALSSNWYTKVGPVVKYIEEIEKRSVSHHDVISLQASIDGPPGDCTKHGHPGDWEIYRKNFDEFIYLIKQNKFKNVWDIKIPFNSTIDKNIFFKIFNTENGIKEYFQYMFDFWKELKEKSKNTPIWIIPAVPGVALPFQSTVEEGYKFYECIRRGESVFKKYFKDIPYFNDLIFLRAGNYFIQDKSILSANRECGEFKNSITMLPDGTIVECNGCYIEALDYYLDELYKENNAELIKHTELMRKFFYNPLKMSDIEISRMNHILEYGYRNTFSISHILKSGLINEMALSRQLPSNLFNNPEKQLKYINLLSKYHTCSRENMKQSYTPYCGGPEQFRRLYNGAVQFLYDNGEYKAKKEFI